MQLHIVLKPLSETYGITITNTISSLPTIPSNTLEGLIQIEEAGVRAKFNATNSVTTCATSGVGGGFLMRAGSDYVVKGWDNLNRMRLYRDDSATDGYINVIFSGEGEPS